MTCGLDGEFAFSLKRLEKSKVELLGAFGYHGEIDFVNDAVGNCGLR